MSDNIKSIKYKVNYWFVVAMAIFAVAWVAVNWQKWVGRFQQPELGELLPNGLVDDPMAYWASHFDHNNSVVWIDLRTGKPVGE